MEKSKLDTIRELYKSLSPRDKILFSNFYNRIKEQEKLEAYQKRLDVAKSLFAVKNSFGNPYFSSDWVIKNILKEN